MTKKKGGNSSEYEVVDALVDYESDVSPKDDKDHDEPPPQQSDEESE